MLDLIKAALVAVGQFLGIISKAQDQVKAAGDQADGAAKVVAADERARADSLERQNSALLNATPGRAALADEDF
jgi:hypothetical protein